MAHAITKKICHDVWSVLLAKVMPEHLKGLIRGKCAIISAASEYVVGIFP
jgi:hypothetical protein